MSIVDLFVFEKMSTAVFESKDFSDEQIIEQLVSLEHQTFLEEHGPWLCRLGPCLTRLSLDLKEAKVRTKEAAISCLSSGLQRQTDVEPKILGVLQNNAAVLLPCLRNVAETYLARGSRAAPRGDPNASEVPAVELRGESGTYIPKRYLARGSASVVYSAARTDQVDEAFVLKRVYPTQYESALAEYKIANRLSGCSQCLSYLDCIFPAENEKEIWLVLPLVPKSEEYGVDLRDFIDRGFFQKTGHESYARSVVMQLLQGLKQVSTRGIIMRDVKPDNVLISFKPDNKEILAYWTDFGLAVDMGSAMDGSGLRRVSVERADSTELEDDLVGWWYDTCKLVPRPKWKARGPPERAFQNPEGGRFIHTYDTYMVAIIFVSMAVGIDIPHIDQASTKKALENVHGNPLPSDYLRTFQLEQGLQTHRAAYAHHFNETFGQDFGTKLFGLTSQMLSRNHQERPNPEAGLKVLS